MFKHPSKEANATLGITKDEKFIYYLVPETSRFSPVRSIGKIVSDQAHTLCKLSQAAKIILDNSHAVDKDEAIDRLTEKFADLIDNVNDSNLSSNRLNPMAANLPKSAEGHYQKYVEIIHGSFQHVHGFSERQIESFLSQIDQAYRLSSSYQEKAGLQSQSLPKTALNKSK